MIKKIIGSSPNDYRYYTCRSTTSSNGEDPFGRVDIVLEEMGITDKSRLDTF
jgi:hypothetical protein